jgi:hypothetical protein
VSLSQTALFASGIFFGGAVDHAILAAMRRDVTPYGVKAGVAGNWMLAATDPVVAGLLYRLYAREQSGRLSFDVSPLRPPWLGTERCFVCAPVVRSRSSNNPETFVPDTLESNRSTT